MKVEYAQPKVGGEGASGKMYIFFKVNHLPKSALEY